MDANIIILIILAIGSAAAYFYFKFQKKKQNALLDRAALAEKTAQDFVNVKDVGENTLYAMDGMVYCYVLIDGICPELFSDLELKNISQKLASDLSKIRHPWKFISVSKPIDLKKTLQVYSDIYATAEEGRRALLKQEMKELGDMANRGDTLERKHYAVVYGKSNEESKTLKCAENLAKIFSENRVSASILNKKGIVELCNLVNIPAYSHLENRYDFDNTILEAMIRK